MFFQYYQLYHHHLLIPTLTHFTLPPSALLKSIALLPNYSICPFSSTLSPCPQLPLPFFPNLSPDYPFLLHTYHLLTNLLYQLYTIPTPWHPWHKHPTLQYQKYTQTCTRVYAQNPAAPTLLPPLTHPASASTFSATYPTPQISIASQAKVNTPPTPTSYRYYHHGVFYIIYKKQVGNWTGNWLLLNNTSRPGTEIAHQ
jgi:hypothetical protein